jgi:methylglutaconyl-CoA hydratase
MYNLITYQVENRVAKICLNRPDKKNALNDKFVNELIDSFTKAELNDEVKIILLTSQGDVFSAGADLEYLQSLQKNSFDDNLKDSSNLAKLFEKIYTNKKIVIAQVEGHAIAGGCGLATVCDFTFSIPEAKFGYTEVKIGFVPAIVMVFLLRKLGETKAKEILLTGKLFSAEYAEKINLITSVIDKNSINEYVSEFINELLNQVSGQSLSLTKEMINNVQSMNINDALKYASQMNAEARATEDCKKGIDSFLSKQKITW